MNTANDIIVNRHTRILQFLKEEERVTVEHLSKHLNVSPVTIRRDLDFLDKKKYLSRIHGGATNINKLSSGYRPEISFFKKEIVHISEKRRIATKAASLIEDDAILFLNSGSTTLFFLEAIQDRHMRVITNNAAALTSYKDAKVELLLVGGEYRDHSHSFVGDMALKSLQGMYSDYTILGINGFSLEQGLTTTVFSECSINQAMIQNTQGKVMVLADFSKIGVYANFISADLDVVDILVTDNQCPTHILKTIEARGIEVHIA